MKSRDKNEAINATKVAQYKIKYIHFVVSKYNNSV